MSAQPRASFGGDGVKSRTYIKKSANREKLYKQSFAGLDNETIYRDPLGFKTGTPVTLQKQWGEAFENEEVNWGTSIPGANRCSLLKKWNELQRKGFGFEQTRDMIAKSLDTGDWQLPLDIIQDVFIVKPEQTPAADFIPRVTTQDDIVHATPQTDQPEPEFDLEGAATNGEGDRVYTSDDADYADLDYDVLGYGVQSRISDKMILASSNLRNAETTTEEALMLGHRQKTERQIIWGQQATLTDTGDANGWGGFADYGVRIDPLAQADYTTPEDLKNYVEELIDEVEFAGADLSSIAVFLPFDAHRTLRRAFTDLIRYEAGDELDTGFATFAMEGGNVPVFKTNAIPRISDYPADATNDAIFAVDMDSVALYQLNDVTLRPLAKLGPEERMAADQYNVLVSQSGDGVARDADHIQIGQVDVPA